MSKHYFELRLTGASTTVAADVARHLQTRQYLGTAIVVCENPIIFMSVVRKQWLKLVRALQKQRASTLNAEEILRITRDIMHMQRYQFSHKLPAENPMADVYFITAQQAVQAPMNCYSVYLTVEPEVANLQAAFSTLPNESLVINYDTGISLSSLDLAPKAQLEANAWAKWQELVRFLHQNNIDVRHFKHNNPYYTKDMDAALDILLNISLQFLEVAVAFQRAIDLAQPPLYGDASQQQLFTSVARLAHRVQALSPVTFTNQFTHALGDHQDTYFLHDTSYEELMELLASPMQLSPTLSRIPS